MNATTRRDLENSIAYWTLASTNPYNNLDAEDITYATAMAEQEKAQLNRWNNERRP